MVGSLKYKKPAIVFLKWQAHGNPQIRQQGAEMENIVYLYVS